MDYGDTKRIDKQLTKVEPFSIIRRVGMGESKAKDVLERSYRKRQKESFTYLDTKAEEWRACDIAAMNQATGEIEFNVPNYTVVTPITDRLPADQLFQLQQQMEASGWAKGLCELCGALIKFPHPIVHDGKKLVMNVGSECVNNYTNAGKEYKKKKKEFKDHLIRDKFRVWVPIAISDIWAKGRDREGHFKPGYYKFMKTLEKAKLDIDDLTPTKMRNMFKKAHGMSINVPVDYIPEEKDD